MAFSDITDAKEITEYLRKVLSRPGGKKSETMLYHYTTIQTAVSIVENHCVWLGSTDRMNDYLEGEFIQSVSGRTMHFACFSKVEENLAMYKMYGSAPDGVMLSISYKTASEILDAATRSESGICHVNIIRDEKVTNDQIEADVYWSEVCYKDLHTDVIKVGSVENRNIYHPLTVQELAGYVKLYGWEYEKEVRLCADIRKPLAENERIAIKLPDDLEISVVFGPGFDKTKNRQLISKLKRSGINTQDSEYDSLVDLGRAESPDVNIIELEDENSELRRHLKEIKDQATLESTKMERRIKELETEIQDYKIEIRRLKQDAIDYSELLGEDKKDFKQRIEKISLQCDYIAGFSHSVSHNIKKLVAQINKPIDDMLTSKITEFLKLSVNTLEKLLSVYYEKEIRASIKITNSNDTLKTYARGSNNVSSRGGNYRCSELNKKEIKISDNYAYIAIIRKNQDFFSESNLLNLNNKFESDDVFFCEYDDYTDLFYSTIIMPIRIPVYRGIYLYNYMPVQEVLGLVCIDCKEEISEWSDKNIQEYRTYHIIADYADSLALLMKEYRDASK